MSNYEDPTVSRRRFLKAVAVTAVAATATGGGAAILNRTADQTTTTAVTSAPAPAMNSPTTAVPSVSGNQDLLARLAASQAENVRLQAALDAAQRQLETVQTNQTNASAVNENLSLELAQANEQVSVLAGLVALYEQLDDMNVNTMLANGFDAVSTTLDTLLADVPSLEESIAAGKQALLEFEEQIPLVENGRSWLTNHLGKLQGYFDAVERLLEQAVETAAPFLEMINQWFADIKKWLPFGIGQKAADIMQSITTLIIETPNTIAGLETNISQPLAVWLAPTDEGDVPLRKNLVKPIREEVIAKSSSAVGKARQVETTYKTALKDPLETAVADQNAIRTLIAEYRQQHGI